MSGRVSGPILTSPFQEVLNLRAAADKFVIHVHGTPHLDGLFVGCLVMYLQFWRFPGGFCITASGQQHVTNSAE